MLGVAQEAQGPERVRRLVLEQGIQFPVLVDRESLLARELGFRTVPSGFFIERGTVLYANTGNFEIGDRGVRRNLANFLDDQPLQDVAMSAPVDDAALALFASGVDAYDAGDVAGALRAWRLALDRDPDNFLIRSQIWVAEHPEHFYPSVDRAWQERQLIEEGYDKPLP
ncbi:MAG: hypothetical protein ACTHQQ_09995 [Solirubrobacteraceae bacterium]